MNFISAKEDVEFEESTLFDLMALKIIDILDLFLYLIYADSKFSIEGYIDLSVVTNRIEKASKKNVVAAYRRLLKAGLIQELHTDNWKHRKVIIHPISKFHN